MKIVVGLGNPGPKYETTRHNVGWLALDRLIDAWKAAGPQDSNRAEVWQAAVGGEKALLLKPQTFMNLSGASVAPVMGFYKCKPEDLVVIHDDLDLKSGQLRIKTGGGTGGHNGLKSLDACLGAGATGYHRIRIGIGRPSDRPETSRIEPVDWVLQQFGDGELGGLDSLFDEVVRAAEMIFAGDVKGAMNRFNGKSP